MGTRIQVTVLKENIIRLCFIVKNNSVIRPFLGTREPAEGGELSRRRSPPASNGARLFVRGAVRSDSVSSPLRHVDVMRR